MEKFLNTRYSRSSEVYQMSFCALRWQSQQQEMICTTTNGCFLREYKTESLEVVGWMAKKTSRYVSLCKCVHDIYNYSFRLTPNHSGGGKLSNDQMNENTKNFKNIFEKANFEYLLDNEESSEDNNLLNDAGINTHISHDINNITFNNDKVKKLDIKAVYKTKNIKLKTSKIITQDNYNTFYFLNNLEI